MKKKIALALADALESGEYKQGVGQLRRDNRFCCLGVLCNLHAQAHPRFAASQINWEEYDGEESYPSERVIKWSGLRTADGVFGNDRGDSLAGLNDNGEKFKTIAAVIREKYKEL